MVFADQDGQVIDHPELEMVVFDGARVRRPRREELIPLPEGSDLFLLPGRQPLGRDRRRKRIRPFAGSHGFTATAMAAFIAPAYLRLAHPAFATTSGAPELPLFGYAPLGWMDGRFWTAGVRVDPERRQDPPLFNLEEIRAAIEDELPRHPKNRLFFHLRRCALEYGCRAAQNFYLRRWEAPLPTSQACNAGCIGCISAQPEGRCPANHERIAFVPTPEEVAEVAVTHFGRVEEAVASFGQGCEGEPLLNATLLVDSVRQIRAATSAGTVNLNSNASRPAAVAELMDVGLDSLRITFASAREKLFDAYHQPRGYGLGEALASARAVKQAGGFLSLNLLVFPGVTDTEGELEALAPLLTEPGVDMIQLRNLNVDPELYRERARTAVGEEEPMGLLRFMERLREHKPDLMFGYFNPPRERFGAGRWVASGGD